MIYRLTKAKAGRACTLSGFNAILAFLSQSKHGMMWYLAKCRFWPSPVRNFYLESTWIWRPLGFFDRHYTKEIGRISCGRTLSGPGIQDFCSGLS